MRLFVLEASPVLVMDATGSSVLSGSTVSAGAMLCHELVESAGDSAPLIGWGSTEDAETHCVFHACVQGDWCH